ncbi:MAG: hypothetical protein L3J91_01885, partial [Thermoplasmata archaeon]|nr:hypothetical protein [Thermoplasmata archaeon]
TGAPPRSAIGPRRRGQVRRSAAHVLVPALIVLVALGLLLPTPALAATTVKSFAASKLAVSPGGNSVPTVTVLGHGLLKVTGAIAGDPRAGTIAAGAHGVAGTVRTLPSCAVGTCNDSYRGASTPALVTGHYAAWLELSLVQPPRATGTAFGFSVEFAVHTTLGWFIVTAYFSSGTTRAAAGHTIHLNVLVDLGTTVLPTVSADDATLSSCATAARCP